MIADSVGFVVDRGREAVYDAEHFFDGYKADRDYALATLRAARQAGSRTLVLCDTNGGTLTDELVTIIGDVRASLEADPDAPAGHLGHPHPQRRRAGGGQLDGRRGGRHPPRPGDDQRLRRAGRQRQHGQHPGQPRAQDAPRPRPGRRRRPAGPDRAVTLGRRDRQRHARRLPALRRALRLRPQGRRPRRGRGQGRAELPAHRSDRGRQRGPAGRVRARRARQHLDPRRAARPSARGRGRPARAVEADQGARGRWARVRGGRGELRAAHPPPRRRLRGAVPDRRLHLPHRAARRPRDAGRGDGQGRGRRRDAAHRGRRQRPGQRARFGAAQGAPRVLPGAGRGPPGRLQGAHPRRRRGDGRADPGDHRFDGRGADLVDDGQRHQHHRGVRVGARRFARVRHLEIGLGAAPPRRATLHHGGCADATAPAARGATATPRRQP